MAPLTRHTISGKVEAVPQHLVDHEFFGQYLEVVDEDTKPFAEGLFHSGTIEDRAETHPTKTHEQDESDDKEVKVFEEPAVPLKDKPTQKDNR